MHIRKAKQHDLAEINRLITDTNIGEMETKVSEHMFVAEQDGRVVGCVGAEFVDSDAAILVNLAVNRSSRKRGAGTALHERVVNHCDEQGAKTIAFITMYYHFRRFKKRGFVTIPRKQLPEPIRQHPMFTDKNYMKCAAMIRYF